jgi:hypothetical protein
VCEEVRGLHEENDSVLVQVYLSRYTKINKYCICLLNFRRNFKKSEFIHIIDYVTKAKRTVI